MVGGDRGPRVGRQAGENRIGAVERRETPVVGRERLVRCDREVEKDDLPAAPERDGVRRAPVTVAVVRRDIAGVTVSHRVAVEEAPPALTRARAAFVVAAHRRDRCGGKKRRCRPEEIRRPGVPAVPPWAGVAAVRRVGTGVFAVQIVADVDDQVGMLGGGARGDPGEWEGVRIVARLRRIVRRLDPAPGVADHDDAVDDTLRHRQRHTADRRPARRRRQRGVAHRHRKRGRFRIFRGRRGRTPGDGRGGKADRHRYGATIDHHHRARRRRHHPGNRTAVAHDDIGGVCGRRGGGEESGHRGGEHRNRAAQQRRPANHGRETPARVSSARLSSARAAAIIGAMRGSVSSLVTTMAPMTWLASVSLGKWTPQMTRLSA